MGAYHNQRGFIRPEAAEAGRQILGDMRISEFPNINVWTKVAMHHPPKRWGHPCRSAAGSGLSELVSDMLTKL